MLRRDQPQLAVAQVDSARASPAIGVPVGEDRRSRLERDPHA
jgi:hypothetical protein